MSTFFELTALETLTLFTGSVPGNGNTNGALFSPIQDVNGTGPSISTGSWFGLANTWGASALLTGTLTGSLSEGHWWGIDISWGTYLIPTESIDRNDPTSNMFVSPDQGVAPGAWDPFPIPVPPPPPPLPPRDLTRYRKAYSFGRNQPVRIRLVRGT